ncbi:hypothetical protein ACUQWX_25670, partial [Klebsiella variicola]
FFGIAGLFHGDVPLCEMEERPETSVYPGTVFREEIRTREVARSDFLDYIEMFYNSKHRHGLSAQMSLIEYKN